RPRGGPRRRSCSPRGVALWPRRGSTIEPQATQDLGGNAFLRAPLPFSSDRALRQDAAAPRGAGSCSCSSRLRVPASPRPSISAPRLPVSPLPRQSQSAESRPAQPARIAILIDDLGNDSAAVDRISRWPQAVSAAVLPGLPGSVRAARQLEASGKEVLLH